MNAIAVTDLNWAIGREGGLLFTLPADMKRFRSLTMGGTVILGRRTLVSFPNGKPLPGRRNIVVTRNEDFRAENAEVVSNPEAALELAGGPETENLWVIGGGSIYAALLARCRRACLTRVDARAVEPDTYFPNLDKLPGWEIEHTGEPVTENGLTYRFVDYINRRL